MERWSQKKILLGVAIRNWMRRSPLVAFFVIAISITWFFQILGFVLADRNDLVLINEDNLVHFFALSHCVLRRGRLRLI